MLTVAFPCFTSTTTAPRRGRSPSVATSGRSPRTRVASAWSSRNLFRNAVTHGGADVHVTVGRTSDRLFVEDDGPGIPSGERLRVFDRRHSTTDGGSGFGLAIVRRIVEEHGWRIAATRAGEGGARFEIVTDDRRSAATATAVVEKRSGVADR